MEDLPFLLGDALSKTELRTLLTLGLKHPELEVRSLLPGDERYRTLFSHPNDVLPERLDVAQMLQVLLLLSDHQLVELLDIAILSTAIKIPPTEVRTTANTLPGNFWECSCECSSLGFRSRQHSHRSDLSRLRYLIVGVYGAAASEEDLEWVLRNEGGEFLERQLETYLSRVEPRDAVQGLLFRSRAILNSTLQLLSCEHLKAPSCNGDESLLLDRLLWKLGIDLPRFPPLLSRFWELLETLKRQSDSLGGQQLGIDDIETLRSSAANLFVSLESVLDATLSFAAWVLLSDHFGSTAFRYSIEAGRQVVAEKLSHRLETPSGPVVYDRDGKHTLFPLSEGFGILKDVCEEILKDDKTTFLRKEDALPHWSVRAGLDFSFPHTVLVLDIERTQCDSLLSLLGEATAGLRRGKVAEIRNRCEHNRRDFPSPSEFLDMVLHLERTIMSSESAGLTPILYYDDAITMDQYGRTSVSLTGYQGRRVHVTLAASWAAVQGVPSLAGGVLLLPGVTIGNSNEPLRFTLEEESEYRRLWSEYPRRRTRTAGGNVADEDSGAGRREMLDLGESSCDGLSSDRGESPS
ncbi:MAG: hypothetical protein IT431_11095 [Phycisphaerales bacterium]|nr:hypothetical protein [Phycisphaerales bacterium]